MARPHQFPVTLTEEERNMLKRNCQSGNWRPRKVLRAKILMLADTANSQDESPLKTEEIAERVGCSTPTVITVKKRFQEERIGALDDKPRSGRPRIIDGEVEAQMIAIACSESPKGRERWTLRLIADKLVTIVEGIEGISYTTVGKALKKTNSNPGSKKNGK